MQEITFEIDAQRAGRANGFLGGLTVERYTFTGAEIPAGTRLAILTRAGTLIAAAEIAEGNAAEVDTNTQEVADLLRYQPLGTCETVYIALGDADNILAIIPATMRKNWIDDEATHPPVPANRYPTKTELGQWLARFDERATATAAAQSAAESAATSANNSATAAQDAATDAGLSAKVANDSATEADEYKRSAETSQSKAEAAQRAAEAAASAASSSAAESKDATTAASNNAAAAQTAATSAQNAASAASNSANAAKQSETAAAESSTSASASATAANASANAASSSATAAAKSAAAAKASETAAANSATAAEAAKTAAEAAKEQAEASATRAEIALNNGCVYEVRDISDATIGLDKTVTAYKHAPTGETAYTFNAPQGSDGKIIVFWLWLVMGETAPQVTFPSSVAWLYEPALAPNTQTLLAFMSVDGGASYVANVQWEKQL